MIFSKRHESTIKRNRDCLLDFLYKISAPRISFGSLAQRLEAGAKLWGDCFTFIMDGSEQAVVNSSDDLTDSKFYSVKKSRSTINVVVIIGFSGKILWLSPSYPGSYNDNVIIRKHKDEWFLQLDDSEWGLGDSGFSIMDEDFRIICPPSYRNDLYKMISRFRIKIE